MSQDTKQIDDGGPAFPGQVPTGYDPRSGNFVEGMSLRDWFAGKALEGELASQSSEVGEWPNKAALSLASRCYAIADAMLAARKAVSE